MITLEKIILHREYDGGSAAFYDIRTDPKSASELISDEEFGIISLVVDNMFAFSNNNYSEELTIKMKNEIEELKEYFSANAFEFLTTDISNYINLYCFTDLRFNKSCSNTIKLLDQYKKQGLIDLELIETINEQDYAIESNISAYKRDLIFLIVGVLLILSSIFLSKYSKIIGYSFFPGILIVIMSFSLMKRTSVSQNKVDYIKK